MAMLSPWMTTEKSFQGEKTSFKRTIFLNGFDSILRTGWGVAACSRKQGRNGVLIESNESDKNLTQHFF
jgi:hypothetical protein